MTNKHLALQVRNSLQKFGVQADPDALFDVILQSLIEDGDESKLTLRDQFAIAVLTGMSAIVDERTYGGRDFKYRDLSVEEWQTAAILDDAKNCYTMADAMLEARREAKGLTQEALGAATGFSGQQIGAWEKGKHTPNVENIGKVAKELGVPGAFFIVEEEDEK